VHTEFTVFVLLQSKSFVVFVTLVVLLTGGRGGLGIGFGAGVGVGVGVGVGLFQGQSKNFSG
jgi:hypothetical protein